LHLANNAKDEANSHGTNRKIALIKTEYNKVMTLCKVSTRFRLLLCSFICKLRVEKGPFKARQASLICRGRYVIPSDAPETFNR